MLEGLPKGRIDLLPEPQDYQWNIAPNQVYVTAHGKRMYLVCRYHGLRKDVNFVIPRDATACRIEETDKGKAAWCETPAGSKNKVAKDARDSLASTTPVENQN